MVRQLVHISFKGIHVLIYCFIKRPFATHGILAEETTLRHFNLKLWPVSSKDVSSKNSKNHSCTATSGSDVQLKHKTEGNFLPVTIQITNNCSDID